MNTEVIRLRFKPESVRLLLIGESPPAKGGFFYVDSAMTKFTRQAFENAHGKKFKDIPEFLSYFKACGCYLDDLSEIPVNEKDRSEREKILDENVNALAKRIMEANPSEIAVVLRRIERYVIASLEKSGSTIKPFVLPFPGHGHQNKYIEALSSIVKKFKPL